MSPDSRVEAATTAASATSSWLDPLVREIRGYPRPGVTFRDITPLLGDAAAFARAVDELVDRFVGEIVNRVIGIESRGFIIGAPVAYRLGAGFVPARKAGKLPWAVVREAYRSEYGDEKLELHRDAIHPDERVLVIDDVLATGGTARAAAHLVESLGGVIVGLGVMIELADLEGRSRLAGHRVESLAVY